MEQLHCPAVARTLKKLVIGIVGGIGAGKSTVAAEFARLGCKIIDADKIAHELLAKKTVREKIIGRFGRFVANPNSKINRRKLAAIVFADAEHLSWLNHLLHPLVLRRIERLIGKYKGQKRLRGIVLDMPLLAEVGWVRRCDRVVFVECRPNLRLDRAKKKGIFNKNQLKRRENFQISLDNKLRLADNIINNNSGLAELSRQVADIFSRIVDNK